jgi:hypothetical protein
VNNESERGVAMAPAETGRHSKPVMELARILYEKMEHLDPGSGGGSSWDDLPDFDVEFYALSVEEIIKNASLVLRALSDYDVVVRHPKLPKKMDGNE